MKRLAPTLAAVLLLAMPGAAQVVDTIHVEVYGVPEALVVEGPLRAYVGDTIDFAFDIVDAEGNPTVGVLTWAVEDSTRARIVAETDSTLSVALLRPGRLTLIANVDRIDRLVLGGTYGEGTGSLQGTFQWAAEGPFTLPCPYGGAEWPPPDQHDCATPSYLAMCAVGFAGSRAIFASNGACADAIGIGVGGPGGVPDGMTPLKLAWLRTFSDLVQVVPATAFKNLTPMGAPVGVAIGV